jgi:cell division protein FtsB
MSENSLEKLNTKIAHLENKLANYDYEEEGKSLKKRVNQLENEVKNLKKRQDYLKSESYRDYYFDQSTNKEVIKGYQKPLI